MVEVEPLESGCSRSHDCLACPKACKGCFRVLKHRMHPTLRQIQKISIPAIDRDSNLLVTKEHLLETAVGARLDYAGN